MHPKVSLPPAPDAGPDRYTKRYTVALGFSLVCRIEYPDCVVLELLKRNPHTKMTALSPALLNTSTSNASHIFREWKYYLLPQQRHAHPPS